MLISAKIIPYIELTLISCSSDDDGDDDTDTDEESGQTYTAVSQTPTRITLTANAVLKKKAKNRLKSTVFVVISATQGIDTRPKILSYSHHEILLESFFN